MVAPVLVEIVLAPFAKQGLLDLSFRVVNCDHIVPARALVQIKEVLHLHLVDELGKHDKSVSQPAGICAIVGLHARTVQTIVESKGVNCELATLCSVYDELYGLGGWLQHTFTV